MQLMGTKEYKYLTNVDSPTELRALSVDELPQFCDELRNYIRGIWDRAWVRSN